MSAPPTVVERARIDERFCGSGRAADVIVQKAGLWLDFLSHCQDAVLLVKKLSAGRGPTIFAQLLRGGPQAFSGGPETEQKGGNMTAHFLCCHKNMPAHL